MWADSMRRACTADALHFVCNAVPFVKPQWQHRTTTVIFFVQEVQGGKLLLYGGFGADSKPLHDVWLLDLDSSQWTCLFYASPDTVSQVHIMLPGWLASHASASP